MGNVVRPKQWAASNKREKHKWQFVSRFRRDAFGWQSQPAIKRIKEAVSEIKRAARSNPLLGAEGAITFLERVSPAIQHVDGSSGAIGTAVDKAIDVLVPIIADAPVEADTREKWLERLWVAHENDQIPYLEALTHYWGELCATKEFASRWADELVSTVRQVFNADSREFNFFHGTSACLSALFKAERYEEIVELLRAKGRAIWAYEQWRVRSLAALGRPDEALQIAQTRLDQATIYELPYSFSPDVLPIASTCEEILIYEGKVEEAYERFGFIANEKSSNLATFRAIAKKYPKMDKEQVLTDLIKRSAPQDRGKWFATAKSLKMFDLAIELVNDAPCDPKTLNRSARDHIETHPVFALQCALASLRWTSRGYGYEVTNLDVLDAFCYAKRAAKLLGKEEETKDFIWALFTSTKFADFVKKSIGTRFRRM